MISDNDTVEMYISVVQSTGDLDYILETQKNKFEKLRDIPTELILIDNRRSVKISFPSSEAYYAAYQRDVAYYEAAMQILLENPGLLQKKVLGSSTKNLENENQEMFCTLFCKTSDKTLSEIIINLSFKSGKSWGLSSAYEETDNGFLLFFKTQLDYDIGLADVSNLEEFIKFLEDRKAITNEGIYFLHQLRDSMETKIQDNRND